MKLLIDGVSLQPGWPATARIWSLLVPQIVRRGNVEVLILDRGSLPAFPGSTAIPFPAYKDRYTADDSKLIQKMCDFYSIDVFTSTFYTSPMSTPMLLLVHDLTPEIFGFDPKHRLEKEKAIAISFARKFIAVSKTAKADLLRHYPEIPASDVVVAHPGNDIDMVDAVEEACFTLDEAAKAGSLASFFDEWARMRDLQSSVDVDRMFS